jgi:hypothetical protein
MDLMIEADNVVLGIENKLDAPFQDGQPMKYLSTIEQRARELSKLRNAQLDYLIVMLEPANRRPESERRIRGQEAPSRQDHYAWMAWEKLLIAIGRCEHALDSRSQVVAKLLQEYLQDRISFPISKCEQHLSQTRAWFPSGGSEPQRDMVTRLCELLSPYAGRRIGYGATWAGYYVGRGQLREGHVAWLGFVSKRELKGGTPEGAELLVAATFDIEFSAEFHRVKLEHEFLGRGTRDRTRAWTIDFSGTWCSRERWVEALEPFRHRLTKHALEEVLS